MNAYSGGIEPTQLYQEITFGFLATIARVNNVSDSEIFISGDGAHVIDSINPMADKDVQLPGLNRLYIRSDNGGGRVKVLAN